jgi:hypothetical protein
MQPIVFASSLIKMNDLYKRPDPDPRQLELLYSAPWQGFKDTARVGAAIGGVALYAGLLAVLAQ